MKHLSASIAACLLIATGTTNAALSDLIITEFMASNSNGLVDGTGANPDWIEIHNPTGASISLSGAYLTDNENNLTKWSFPPTASVPAGGYLVVCASGLSFIDGLGYTHTSFKLDADGEDVLLVDTNGTTIISGFLNYPSQGSNVSYGLGSNLVTGYFATPTPGAANGPAGNGFVADTQFNIKRGFYETPFQVTISTPTPGATIRYTLDCSSPTETNGTIYTGPITVSGTTTLRAFAYKTDYFPTDIDTQTYIFISQVINQPATRPNSSWPVPTTGSSTVQAMDYAMDTKVTTDPRYADLMDDALLSIPSVSIVTDLTNLFGATGVYSNPTTDGLEKPASIEWINPDNSEGFHVNAGIRIRGGVSESKTNPKHSFRVLCKPEYGDSKIEYPLLGPGGRTIYDKIDFRTAQNFSWHFNTGGPAGATWLDDPFSHDTMNDMGNVAANGPFHHLYVNGLYWGLFQVEERMDAQFCTSYFGGEEDDFDVMKSDEVNGLMYANEGTDTFYDNFWTAVNAGVSTNSAYFALQDRNSDGTANGTLPHYLDAANLIDYMLVVFYTGAQDMPLGPPSTNSQPRNLYASADRVNGDGFKWLVHDNEWSMVRNSGVNINRVAYSIGAGLASQNFFNPWWLHNRLKTNSEYVVQFGDRVHKHFFNGGALTAAACTARYQERMAEINLAIIAESARWGDYLPGTSSNPRDRDDDWIPATNWILNSFMNATPSTRSTIVLNQLFAGGLYPTVTAPTLSPFGGEVVSGSGPTITAPSGTIYYTTNGTDPRLIGGAIAPGALTGASGLNTALTANATVNARVFDGSTWSALASASYTVPPPSHVGEWTAY